MGHHTAPVGKNEMFGCSHSEQVTSMKLKEDTETKTVKQKNLETTVGSLENFAHIQILEKLAPEPCITVQNENNSGSD